MPDSTLPPIQQERERRLSNLSIDRELLLDRRLQWVTWARIGILALFAVNTVAAFSDTRGETPLTLVFATTISLVANVIYLFWLRSSRALTLLGALQISGDLALWCVVMFLTGGASSAFSVLFDLSVIVATFLFGSRGAISAAIAASTCYTLVAIVSATQILSPPSDVGMISPVNFDEVVYYLVVNVAGLSLVGVLAGLLAERERRAGGRLEEAKRLSADLAALNDDIVRSLTIGLAAMDMDGRVMWISPAGASILDGTPKDIVGAPINQIIPFQESLPPPHVIENEIQVEFPNDRVQSLAYRLAPLVDGMGSTKGSLLVFQDQTQLVRMQEKVERAGRLAALGRLAAGLAHELRNPLGSISGSLEMIRESTPLSDEDQRLFAIMLREIERLADLVSQMLDLARPRPPEPVEVDLVPIIREVTHVISASADAEELSFELDLPEDLLAEVDPRQVRQLLWNLLRNAAQASSPGSSVRVVLHRSSDNLVIEVTDSGPGIPSEKQEQIFEPFYSTKRGGIGMGLSICRQVAQGHGGALMVIPADPIGSTFRVVLPIEAKLPVFSPIPLQAPRTTRRSSWLP
jgi:two-component system sensor histidine kinase PilS (NtrC family)